MPTITIHEPKEVEVVPCPFCGRCEMFIDEGGPKRYVACKHCEATGPSAQTDLEAIDFWNRCNPMWGPSDYRHPEHNKDTKYPSQTVDDVARRLVKEAAERQNDPDAEPKGLLANLPQDAREPKTIEDLLGSKYSLRGDH